MLELYRNIKKYRLAKKMSQAELALLAGYTDRSSIAKIEKGDVDLPQSKIVLIASALGVKPGVLMGSIDDPDTKLSDDEASLLEGYRALNSFGKEKAQEYIEDLAFNDKYRKFTESSIDTKGGVAG